jgi:Polyketide cyclase / dehydrase and lipid transport
MGVATVTHIFPVPVQALWDLIGDFGDTGKWSGRPPEACIRDGEGVGALRTLTLADGRVIVDRLEAQGEYYYSYSIVTSPLPVRSYRATMSVAPLTEDSSILTWSGNIEPEGLSDNQAVALFEDIYRMGIGLINRSIAVETTS